MNSDYIDKQAQINALKTALRQTNDQAIEHIENVLSAHLATMTPTNKRRFKTELAAIERLTQEELEIVQLSGETDEGEKSQRQKWREELAELEGEL